jgi:predicted O-methyltransferase YrrM
MSARNRVRILESLTPSNLFDVIGSPEIGRRVAETLRGFTEESRIDSQELEADSLAGKESWSHLHVLTWYAGRFRPVSYLEIGSDFGLSMRMVARSSPETQLVSCTSDGREISQAHFRVGRFMKELNRYGSIRPITLLRGDNLARQARYFTDWALRAHGRGQPEIKEFDLIFVDGSRGQRGVHHDLKSGFARCALAGIVVFRGMDRPDASLPGQYCPRLSGYWERLPLRFPGFRYVKAPQGKEIGIAYRVA